ncbi:MAG: MFS transporter [Pseudomonadota bacterium]
MKRVLISGAIGNALEWYDFAIYAHFSVVISQLFFPNADPYLATMATWGVFAAGFIMRPVGAIVFGIIGDRYGRRASLAISILMMSIPTACIGILPSYNEIGIAAPVILTIIRLLQGLSLGGEFSGAISLVTEHAPNNKRGFAGSITMFSMCIGILLGSAIVSALYWFLGDTEVTNWAWRLPFLFGLALGIVGLYIRKNLDESPKYVEAQNNSLLSKNPTKEVFKNYHRELISGMLYYVTVAVPFYTFVFFMREFLFKYKNLPYDASTNIATLSLIVMTAILPLSGALSDRYGRRIVLLTGCIGYIIFGYPIFMLFDMGYSYALIGALIFATLVGIYMAPIPAVLAELFPTKVRFTGVAISYNVSASLFGGTAPMVYTYLINKTGIINIAGLYVMFFAFISLITVYYLNDEPNKALI